MAMSPMGDPHVPGGKVNPASPSERFLRGGRRRGGKASRVNRRLLRRRILAGLGVAVAALLVWQVRALSHLPEMPVQRVLVEGNAQLSDGEILELLALDESANLLTLDLEEIRSRLEGSAWVQDVEIERILPATLTLTIHEREPVAVAVLEDLYLLAGDGTVLDQLTPSYDIERLALVRGLREEGGGLSFERRILAGRVAKALVSKPRLAALVSELDVSGGAESLSLTLTAPPITLLAAERNVLPRLREIGPLVEGIQENYPDVEVVDLRFDGRVYLRLRDAAESEAELASLPSPTPGGAPF